MRFTRYQPSFSKTSRWVKGAAGERLDSSGNPDAGGDLFFALECASEEVERVLSGMVFQWPGTKISLDAQRKLALYEGAQGDPWVITQRHGILEIQLTHSGHPGQLGRQGKSGELRGSWESSLGSGTFSFEPKEIGGAASMVNFRVKKEGKKLWLWAIPSGHGGRAMRLWAQSARLGQAEEALISASWDGSPMEISAWLRGKDYAGVCAGWWGEEFDAEEKLLLMGEAQAPSARFFWSARTGLAQSPSSWESPWKSAIALTQGAQEEMRAREELKEFEQIECWREGNEGEETNEEGFWSQSAKRAGDGELVLASGERLALGARSPDEADWGAKARGLLKSNLLCAEKSWFSGSEQAMAQTLSACLRKNGYGIGFCAPDAGGAKSLAARVLAPKGACLDCPEKKKCCALMPSRSALESREGLGGPPEGESVGGGCAWREWLGSRVEKKRMGM